MPLLKVKNLRTCYRTRSGWVKAVNGVSFNLERRETFGIVGESGCGKTTVGLTLMRLLPPNGKIMDGQILFNGIDWLRLTPKDVRRIRWKDMSMIFQAAMNALDPVQRVGDQIIEALRVNIDVTKEEAKTRVRELFKLVGLPTDRMNSYPHELSGGMKQRVVMVMSIICHPKLLIADEPLTALDVVVQDQILQLILELQEKLHLSVIYISHDIATIAETCDRMAIMYGGKILEYGDTVSIFRNPRTPYTNGLLKSVPSIIGEARSLISIPGTPPSLLNPPPGCPFASRCPIKKEVCTTQEPPRVKVEEDHYCYCHFAMEPVVEWTRNEGKS